MYDEVRQEAQDAIKDSRDFQAQIRYEWIVNRLLANLSAQYPGMCTACKACSTYKENVHTHWVSSFRFLFVGLLRGLDFLAAPPPTALQVFLNTVPEDKETVWRPFAKRLQDTYEHDMVEVMNRYVLGHGMT